MRVSFTKEYLVDYIENELMITLYANFREAQRVVRKNIIDFEKRNWLYKLWFEHPEEQWFGTHDHFIMYAADDKIEAVKRLLKTIKNANALNPVVLDNDEIRLLGL